MPRLTVAEARRARPKIVVWEQVLLGLVLFAFYVVVSRLKSADRTHDAEHHARQIWHLERWLHIDPERVMNHWLVHHETLRTIADYEYAFTYIVSAFAALIFLLVRHPEIYRRARMSFVITTGAGLLCFWLYPVMPPRMLPGAGFIDTVTHGHTWGSWGSSLVRGANVLAAMPSLHMAWALWVSVVLLWAGVPRWVQLLSMLHVLITLVVIMSTANHYVLDAVAAVVLVVVADQVAIRIHPPWEGSVVPSADAFFLHVEDGSGDPQVVGGLVFFDPTGPAGVPRAADLREAVEAELDLLPRFTQRIEQPGRWRRPRWIDAPALDWSWHTVDHDVADRAAVQAAVAEYASQTMPRDRPLWRIVLFHMADGQTAFLLLMHHAVADGIGTVLQVMNWLRPRVELPIPTVRPKAWQTAAATAVGFAQLATDGGKPAPLRVPSARSGGRRAFAVGGLPMTELKEAAAGRRITDLVLALTSGAIADAHPELVDRVAGRLKIAVPLMVRAPGDSAEGNATAAVMLDVPFRQDGTDELLDEISKHTAALRSPTRALASRWVMAHLLRLFPEPAVGWFARTVYGHRFFHGIVSNMPGVTQRLSMAGAGMEEVYPVLPLAPGAPFVLGALSWEGILGLGLATDPDLIDADAVTAALMRRFDALTSVIEEAQGVG